MTAKKDIENRLEELGQAIGTDESLVENVMSRIKAKPIAESNRIERRFTMSRLMKLAAAAVIIIIVLVGTTFWPSGNSENKKWWLGSSVAWGQEVLAALDTIKGVSCREQTIWIGHDGSRHTSSTWDIFYVSDNSYRRDIYDGNTLREIQWYVPDGNDMIQTGARFDLECYCALRHKGSFGNRDPVDRMRFYVQVLGRTKDKRLLGEKLIEDHNCVGFEISASEYGDNPEEWRDRIWFDVETKLPVCIEKHGRPVTEHPEMTFTTIQDQFDYSPELPADTFIPYIPEGFINAHPDEIDAARQRKQGAER